MREENFFNDPVLLVIPLGFINKNGRPISRSPFYYGFVAATYFASYLVSSAERGLTSLFGMVRGVHPSYPHQQILDDFLD